MEEDWKEKLGFVTIPCASSGQSYNIERAVDLSQLLEDPPKPGDAFEINLSSAQFERGPGIEWWNWGNLEGDLKGKKLGWRGDPKLNEKSREEEGKKLPHDLVLSFENWRDAEDDEGNQMVWLEIVFGSDRDLVRVEVVES